MAQAVRYDFIIIGSGTSGGVLAYYLTKAGAKCLLLEAGRAFSAETFPENEMDYSAQMFWNGGLEFNADVTLAFLRGKCLGGGSVVNQCLLDRFDDIAWEDWRSVSNIHFFTSAQMAPHYDEIESKLSIQEIPERHFNRNAQLMRAGFEKLGYRWKPLRRGQTDCKLDEGNDCIACLGGCHRDSKQSTLVTFVKWARDAGLEIWPEFHVQQIRATPQGVTVIGIQGEQTRQEISAPRVILAGGALGTTALLLRSGFKERLPALGQGFYCHPQWMVFALFDEPVDAHKGAFQAIKSDDPRFRAQGFKLENVFAPPVAVAMLLPGLGKRHHELMRKYRFLGCIEVSVRDTTPGELRLDRSGRLLIHKKLGSEEHRRRRAGLTVIEEIFRAVGAREIIIPTLGLGLHLMGGCAIGADLKNSVVNENFQLHGFSNIFVADSSIFPAAPGINPALTIMALSHKASQALVRG
ncbi:MAG: GMC family oxidoreductase [Candidatus Bipolaricaulota bacterium]|nr:GMC family oxidoreductase [Candidatus Bipolaricaulota bacterium]MDW8031457.1 GMC family oxidoreductase [Candidatus Bipolaricaulota bacterium]